MSDQPKPRKASPRGKPATEGCSFGDYRENCPACNPKPASGDELPHPPIPTVAQAEADASGEWTVACDNMLYAGDSRDSNNFLAIIRDDDGRNRIVDAHNAALVAERKDHTDRMNNVQDFYSRQLAAKDEELGVAHETYQSARRSSDMGWKRAEEFKQQLAAEQEKVIEVKRLAQGNITGCGTCNSILAALAKVKEGKAKV